MQSQKLKTAEQALNQEEADSFNKDESDSAHSQLVSFISEVPEPLQTAMASFVENHPNWDQYRLIKAALAGFLVQNGVESRPITRLYVGNMFGSDSFLWFSIFDFIAQWV